MFSKNIATTDTTDGLPNPRRIWAVIAASLALIMSVLDANIVNVVLPTLSRVVRTRTVPLLYTSQSMTQSECTLSWA